MAEEEVVGFGFTDDDVENDKKKFKVKKGSFEAMGLSHQTVKAIKKRGYKVPTPIQRKSIPLIMEGRDVVAMARTGSGKTACFLIPLFERLQGKQSKSGSRAIVLSPTRELAQQTFKFIKELGRFSNLRTTVILGGESMDDQFSAIHSNPDIIVATPGRFLHICVEMDLKLNYVEYIVFDEADRLFEMGFGEQLNDIVNRLPESRQTLLFSATLPKVLVEFAKAGLHDPILLRLDVESKLPDTLSSAFLCCRAEEKAAALLILLNTVLKPKQQTIIFAATKHHIEYLHLFLNKAGVTNTYIFSNLDPAARKINAAKFQSKAISVLLVTDLAARGLDIPHLDNVINYNFPPKPKLFVHRVGRCARAGRTGSAYSLISPEEYPYLIDLHLFLSRSMNLKPNATNQDFVIGRIPQELLEQEHSQVLLWNNDSDLESLLPVLQNAYGKYLRSRPGASIESVRRVKTIDFTMLSNHPIFNSIHQDEEFRINFLRRLKAYKPKLSVFEMGTKNADISVMQSIRQHHEYARTNYLKGTKRPIEKVVEETPDTIELEQSGMDEIKDTFKSIINGKRCNIDALYKQKKKKFKPTIDEDNFIPYMAKDHHTEAGLKVNNFQREATNAELSLTADSQETMGMRNNLKKWDKKKMKIVTTQSSRSGKIKTESGVWIPKTYKSNRYAQWRENSKIDQQEDNDSDEDEETGNKNKEPRNARYARHNKKVKMNTNKRQGRRELKDADQILKSRAIKDKNRARSKRKKDRKR